MKLSRKDSLLVIGLALFIAVGPVILKMMLKPPYPDWFSKIVVLFYSVGMFAFIVFVATLKGKE